VRDILDNRGGNKQGHGTMNDRTRLIRITGSRQVAEDTRVAEEVARMLAASGRFALDRPEVSVSDGVVKLRGRVGSYFQKQVAQSAALTVIGARQVVNEIEVK
jgi:osmotically-inducible protein OsmY